MFSPGPRPPIEMSYLKRRNTERQIYCPSAVHRGCPGRTLYGRCLRLITRALAAGLTPICRAVSRLPWVLVSTLKPEYLSYPPFPRLTLFRESLHVYRNFPLFVASFATFCAGNVTLIARLGRPTVWDGACVESGSTSSSSPFNMSTSSTSSLSSLSKTSRKSSGMISFTTGIFVKLVQISDTVLWR